MQRLAMRVTPEYLEIISSLGDTIEELATSEVTAEEVFAELPYMVITPVSPTEFNMKLMTEDEMFEAFKDDNELHVLN